MGNKSAVGFAFFVENAEAEFGANSIPLPAKVSEVEHAIRGLRK